MYEEIFKNKAYFSVNNVKEATIYHKTGRHTVKAPYLNVTTTRPCLSCATEAVMRPWRHVRWSSEVKP